MRWFRPLFIAVLISAVTIGFFAKLIEATVFVPFATGLIVYWFKARDEEKAKE